MSYVLRRHEDGAYVTRPGSAGSYTTRLERARLFASKEAAEREACGNESVVPVHEILARGG